ncbi:MAG: hypothetical protein DRP97_00290 [Candidatus Latescibacterota bacterium]|nr:MAG: hypothetical protein DRP97_00290 [Candidatus Latescibacterota bacterium]
MTKDTFGGILDKCAVPTGLGNAFFCDCFAIEILSLMGQNLDYPQVLDGAPRLQAFLKKNKRLRCKRTGYRSAKQLELLRM